MSREALERRLNRLLQDLSTETVLLHQAIAERLGLGPSDHKCLGLLLDASEPMTPGQLAERTGLTTGAVTGIVDRLEAAGFVKRKRDPGDRRSITIELNLNRVRRQVFPLFEQLGLRMDAVLASYNVRELETVAEFLERGLAVSREHRAAIRGSLPRS